MASPSGIQLEEVRDAILGAFDKDEFDMLLYERLDYDRPVNVEDGPFKKVVNDVLRDFRRQDLEPMLIAEVAARRPMKQEVQRVYRKYAAALVSDSLRNEVDANRAKALEQWGLVKGVEIQTAGRVAVPKAEVARAGLERTVKQNLPMLDFNLWLRRMLRLGGKICRMEVDEGAGGFGTGFLVGPDLVLTNHHVIEAVMNSDEDGRRVVARFDYDETAQGPAAGLPVKALQNDWLVASSPSSMDERLGQPAQSCPSPTQLDFALIRLSRPLGNEALFANLPEGVKRGWLPLPTTEPLIQPDMPLIIVQHPKNATLKLAMDTQSVIGLRCNGLRLRYNTNTEEGSSGSPVFDINGQLVALHHLGFPVWPANAPGEYNQGVPIAAIYRHLAQPQVNLGPDVSAPSPDAATLPN